MSEIVEGDFPYDFASAEELRPPSWTAAIKARFSLRESERRRMLHGMPLSEILNVLLPWLFPLLVKTIRSNGRFLVFSRDYGNGFYGKGNLSLYICF